MTPEEAIEILEKKKEYSERITDNFLSHSRGEIKDANETIEMCDMAISALKEIQQYREIGTVEECRESVKKQKAKKPLGGADINGNEYMICRECSAIVEDGEWRAMYCPDCGQAIQWDEDLEETEDEL